MKKTKKLGKYLRRIEPGELKTVSGGVNADKPDRNTPLNHNLPGLPGLPGVPFPGGGG